MAAFTIKAPTELAEKLDRMRNVTSSAAKKAVYEAAKVVTDGIRRNIVKLPEERSRVLKNGERFHTVPTSHKKALLDSLGVTKIDYSDKGVWNVKIGFDGYSALVTKKYKKGIPNQLLARSIESGSSVRDKTPFSRPAVQSNKKQALKAMQDAIDDALKKA